MLLSKTVMMKWNSSIRKYYESKGYIFTKQGEVFECKIEDLMSTSTVRVNIKCDYCGVELTKEWRNYINGRKTVEKDCCKDFKCISVKTTECNLIKFGVESNNQRPEVKEKLRESNKASFDLVISYFKSKNLTLITKEECYKNCRSKLEFICNNHPEFGIQETNYSNVKSQKHCCKYGATENTRNMLKMDGHLAYDKFIEKELIPMFEPKDYKSYASPLPYKCPKHLHYGVQYRSYASLISSEGCLICSTERIKNALKTDINVIINDFKSKDLTLLSSEYVNCESSLEFECDKHQGIIQTIKYGSFKFTKCPCVFCREESSLSELSRKVRSSILWWKEDSKSKFNNTCLLSGIKGNVEVHHQVQLDSILKKSLMDLNLDISDSYSGMDMILIKDKVCEYHRDLPMGVCLNKYIHKLFHAKYGKKDCSVDNFYEFISDYFKGRYDHDLDEYLKSINSKTDYSECIEKLRN